MREINEIIIHCTDTPEGRDVTVNEIRHWHKKRGFKDIGYHYVIYRGGQIEVGRPIGQVGAHCKGYNKNSIGIVYVGGRSSDGKYKDTRTIEQIVSLDNLIVSLLEKYPTINSIVGHNKYSNKACPCFDASSCYRPLLNRYININKKF